MNDKRTFHWYEMVAGYLFLFFYCSAVAFGFAVQWLFRLSSKVFGVKR